MGATTIPLSGASSPRDPVEEAAVRSLWSKARAESMDQFKDDQDPIDGAEFGYGF